LIKQSEGQVVGYSFAEYTEHAAAPALSATDIWHPLVGAQKSVTNSIELGGDKPTNIIITGPNAGGKSTFLKGLTLNVLFAQSLGIVPAKKFVVTPFAKINTYMNIADDTAGGNSLFKSEVLRAQSLMNTVKNLPADQCAFSVMDEMFSGTSPKEGEAASYAVSQELGSLPNNMLLLATHFQKLTGLEENTGNFTNYQVRVVQHENGTFSYPFKLELGKADQNVAIQILQQQGFSSSILDNANAILAQK
jgi:DNA mismatch repair protein MutS